MLGLPQKMMFARAAARRLPPTARRFSEAPQKLDRAARRAARLEAGGQATGEETGTTAALWASVAASTAVISGGIYSLMADPEESSLAKAAQSSALGGWVVANVSEASKPFVQPSREKLLPDWPPDYLNISPDVPCPHTLVLDLDDTLVRATWDRRYGWRHAKRPGAEQFLREMAKYYEIVIFTTNIAGVADPVVHALDKDGCAMHRLYRDATMFVRGTHCKDLSKLNRDVRKIVVVDKDRAAVQLQPGNAIIVKPYTDATDRLDTELEDLTPFLAALVNENVRDVPAALAKFSSNDATVVAAEYGDMLKEAKNKTDAVRKIGLGGFVRGRARQPEPDLALEPAGTMLSAAGLSAKDIAGDAPEATPKKGGIFGWWDRKNKEAEEDQKKKMEAWQKVLQKKEAQKRLAAEARAAA